MSEASGAGVIEPPMEQILLAGSNTSLYATGPVDPDPSPSGAFACSYADVPTVTNLSEALLTASAEAALLYTTGKPFDKAESFVYPFFSELVAALLKQPGETLPELRTNIASFVDSKRHLLSKLLSADALAERSHALKATLTRGDATWVNSRDKTSLELLRRYDCGGVAHCSLRFDTVESLGAHKLACRFRPMPCENAGCLEVTSQQRVRAHDDACPYKAVPCEQGCPLLVARREMRSHCVGPCAARPVACPFAPLGCTEPVTLGSLDGHVEGAAARHLSLLLAAFVDRGRMFDQHDAQIIALTTVGPRLEQALTATQKTIAGLGDKVHGHAGELRSAQSAAASHERELRSARSEVASLKDELKKARAELAALSKDHQALRGLVIQELGGGAKR